MQPVQTTPQTTHALKEWQIAVEALEQGSTILLLRKGGIREAGGRFVIAHDRMLLYPTYEHQKPHLLKPAYAERIQALPSGWHPETVRIGAWATITETFQVREDDRIAALLPFHIWNEAFVTERLQWKSSQPLLVLLLRVYQLPQPQVIPFNPLYGGCKSWIDLVEPIALDTQLPVLSDRAYAEQVEQICAIGLTP